MAKLFFNHRLFKLVLCVGFSFTFIGCTPNTGSFKTSDLEDRISTPIEPEPPNNPHTRIGSIPVEPEQGSTPVEPVQTNPSLLISQKPSFADKNHDINLMKKYVKTYSIGVECADRNPQYSSCIILKNGAIKMINDLLTEVDEKAIKAPANYCSESSSLYNQVGEIPIGTLRYTWMKNYCNQNGQQF